MQRLLYLGYAFPPGVSALYPELQPAGHLIETSLIDSIRSQFDIRSVGISGLEIERLSPPPAGSPGLPHQLNLLERPPELWHRWNSWHRLRATYLEWQRQGWRPDLILVCNLSPVFNTFVRWLARQPNRPRLILYLADSASLGIPVPLRKRLRRWLKPMTWSDDDMASLFDACVAVSRTTEERFRALGRPWLWLPNGCDPRRALPSLPTPRSGPISFGYFGALAGHAGAPDLLRVFTGKPRQATLKIGGYGKDRKSLEAQYGTFPSVSFSGPFTPDQCLTFGQTCDILVNPRPVWPGNENNFSSKVFEYALTGRPILSSRLSGVELVLGDQAWYFNEQDYDRSLAAALDDLSLLPRTELDRRGLALQQRMLTDYSWTNQGTQLARFLQSQSPPHGL